MLLPELLLCNNKDDVNIKQQKMYVIVNSHVLISEMEPIDVGTSV